MSYSAVYVLQPTLHPAYPADFGAGMGLAFAGDPAAFREFVRTTRPRWEPHKCAPFKSDFPSHLGRAPVFSYQLIAPMIPDLKACGIIADLMIEDDKFVAFQPANVVDCLDVERSEFRGKYRDIIERPVFRRTHLPDFAAFRVPQSSTTVYWTDSFIKRLFLRGPIGLDAKMVWEG